MPYANNKAADQPAHSRSLISTFVIRSLDSIISILKIQKFTTSAGLCSLADGFESWLVGNPEKRFARDEAYLGDVSQMSVLHILSWDCWRQCQGGHWSGKSQGNLIFPQGQGILQNGQGNFKYQEREKSGNSIILAQNICCSRYFDYLKCEKSVDFLKVDFFSHSLKYVQVMTLGWPWPILQQGQIWSLLFLYWKMIKL